MADVRIAQLDGKLPNLALMRLAAWHRAKGDTLHFYRGADAVERKLWEPAYAKVYASAIFEFSAPLVEQLRQAFPGAIVGGTWSDDDVTVEQIIGPSNDCDYSIASKAFTASLGFTQRGCRFKCSFCKVPRKEGRPQAAGTIAEIWRGDPWPRTIHLLDNDFFGTPKPWWKARLAEIRDGGFKVCFNQGINVRVITDEIAGELASVEYRDNEFKRRRVYTAWDSVGDEELFFRGVDRLERAGIPPRNLMAYMLVGFDPAETWERVFHRFERMAERGIKPYPMVYGEKRRTIALGGHNRGGVARQTLGGFQRWVCSGIYRTEVAFEDYDVNRRAT